MNCAFSFRHIKLYKHIHDLLVLGFTRLDEEDQL